MSLGASPSQGTSAKHPRRCRTGPLFAIQARRSRIIASLDVSQSLFPLSER